MTSHDKKIVLNHGSTCSMMLISWCLSERMSFFWFRFQVKSPNESLHLRESKFFAQFDSDSMQFLDVDPRTAWLWQEHGKVAPNILTFHGSPVGCPLLPSKVKYSAHLGHLFLSGQGFGKNLVDGWWLWLFYIIFDERFSDTSSILIIHLNDIGYSNRIQYVDLTYLCYN